jgi:hypothetical protein
MTKAKKAENKVNNYDYTKIDNQDDCLEDAVVCGVCMEKYHKIRLGHKAQHIVYPQTKETLTHIEIKNVINHCHFALRKGTQVPEIHEARNIHCEVSREMVSKKEACNISIRLKNKKKKKKKK